MNNDDPTQPLTIEANNNEIITKPLTGFQLHPENAIHTGRPKKGWTWNDLLIEAMEEKDENGKSTKKIIINKLIGLAKRSDLSAIKEIIDRMDGKSKESIDLNATVVFPHVSIDTKPEEANE